MGQVEPRCVFLGDGECEVEFVDGERMRLKSGKIAGPGEVSPLHLLAASALACTVMNAGHALEKEGIEAEVTGEARAEKDERRNVVCSIDIVIRVKPEGDVDPEEVERVARKGAAKCVITRTLGPVIVDVDVEVV